MRAWATFTIAIGGFTGGVYTDPKHQDYSSFAGYRMLAIKGNGLTLAGTDDGTAFWALSGSISKDGTIAVDFSPKGGPSNVQGKLDSSNHDITWSDGNVWQNLPYPSLRKGHAYAMATSGFSGAVYLDPNHAEDPDSSFAGYRVLVLRGGSLTLEGSDDGTAFWALPGSITEDGSIEIDFSPKGGPSNFKGKLDPNSHDIKWSDGNVWQFVPYPTAERSTYLVDLSTYLVI
jgi:hypothetical protein